MKLPSHYISKMQIKYVVFSFFILFFLLLLVRALVSIDPDLGWHIRIADLIAREGLPTTDPFSYTMPSYMYIDHEWLFHVVLHPLVTLTGIPGVAILFSLIPISMGLYWWYKYSYASLVSIVLFSTVALLRFGIRPQVYSWLLLFIWLGILQSSHIRRLRWVLPLLSIVWVNIHASVVLPLFLLLIYVFCETIQKRFNPTTVFIALLCFLSTFVNPYSFHIWTEIIRQIQEPLVHQHIQEWSRFYVRPELSHLFALTLTGLLLYRYRLRFSLYEHICSLVLLLGSFSAIRHVPLFVMWSGFIVIKGYSYLKEELVSQKGGVERLQTFWKLLIGVAVCIFVIEAVFSVKDTIMLKESNYYPEEAILHLPPITDSNRLFAAYEWGGYLVWKKPELSLFIDGRMPSFRWKAPLNESNSAFEDYISIVKGERVDELFDKYSIRTVLWSQRKINAIPFITFSTPKSEDQLFPQLLESKGWIRIYEDSVSVIYHKPF